MKKNRLVSYKSMFLDDIKKYIEFSIVKYRFHDKNKNIEIESDNENFRNYLLYKNFTYLEYDFLNEVSNLIVSIIEKGHGEAIIVKYKEDEEVKGIEIRVPVYDFKIRGIKYTYFFQRQLPAFDKKKYHVNKFKNEEIISMNYNDLKMCKYKMKKILRKLEKADNLNELLELTQKNLLLHREFERLNEKKEINIYKYTKEIKWNARKYEEDVLNLPYIYYRRVEFYKYLVNLLEITMGIINNKIAEQKDIQCNGKIVVKTKTIEELDELITKFLLGKGKCEDFIV